MLLLRLVLAAFTAVISPRATPPLAGRVAGIVLDSLHNEPLAGARIDIAGIGRFAVSDESGRFIIDSISPGTYDVVARHPLLDSLGLKVGAHAVKVREGATTSVLVAVPGILGIRRLLCGASDLAGGIITGRVVRAGTDEGLPASHVGLSWLSVASDGRSLGFVPGETETISDDRGYFAFCAIPAEFEASIQAWNAADTTALVPVSLAWSATGIVSRSLSLGGSATSLKGTVVDTAGRAISDATVDIPETNAKARSSADGSFTLSGVRAGTRILRARKIGYSSSVATVEAGSDNVQLTLGPSLPKLAPVVVRAIRSDVADRTGFARRMKTGVGHYASGDELVAAKSPCVIDGLRRTLIPLTRGPGCSFDLVNNHHWRGISSLQALLPALPAGEAAKRPVGSVSQSACTLAFVDDVRLQPDTYGDQSVIDLAWLDPEEVVGIEYYSEVGAPAKYGTSHCNVMLIWTIAYRGAHQ